MAEKATPRAYEEAGKTIYICPLCKHTLEKGEAKCPACGTEFDWSAIKETGN